MSPESLQAWVVPIVVALIAGFVGVKGHNLQKGTRENRLIDQLQEEMDTLRTNQVSANGRMARLEARDRVYIPHILKLNWHIEQGLGPPAPPIPELIKEFLEHPEGGK